IKELENVYKVMNNFQVIEANSISDQIKQLIHNQYDFLKYYRQSLSGFKEILKTRNELCSWINKKGEAVEGVFGGLFRQNKESINIPSKNINQLEEQIGYYTQQSIDTFRIILNNKAKAYSKNFIDYYNTREQLLHQTISELNGQKVHLEMIKDNQNDKIQIQLVKKKD
ncbi:PX domain protein, partial [Ichthyophthirius multifiliis]